MPDIFDPAKDLDCANLLLHNIESDFTSNTGINHVGKLRSKIIPGKYVTVVKPSGAPGLIRDVEKVEVDENLTKITITTKKDVKKAVQHVYEVATVSEEGPPRRMPLLYLRRGHLDFNDKMHSPFYDGGRTTKFTIVGNEVIPVQSDREIVIYDQTVDKAFESELGQVQREIFRINDLRERIRLLALLVSRSLGGNDPKYLETIDIRHESEMRKKRRRHMNGLVGVYISHLEAGVCAQRAGKFKYYSDRVRIPCRFVRGVWKLDALARGIPHAWNVVVIDGKFYVVDLMHNPEALYPEGSPEAERYKHFGSNSEETGMCGRSIGIQ